LIFCWLSLRRRWWRTFIIIIVLLLGLTTHSEIIARVVGLLLLGGLLYTYT
jgi:hypothetical protein